MPLSSLRADLPRLLPAAIAWADAEARRAQREGEPLTVHERVLAQRVGVAHPDRVRVVRGHDLPRPDDPVLRAAAIAAGILGPGMAGLTLGHAIFVLRAEDGPRLLSHELRHVHQYEQAGSIAAFLPEYLHQVLSAGYFDAPFERDARAHEIDA